MAVDDRLLTVEQVPDGGEVPFDFLELDDRLLTVETKPDIVYTPGGARITPMSIEDVPERSVPQETVDAVNKEALAKQFVEDATISISDSPLTRDFDPQTVLPDVGKGQLLSSDPFKSQLELDRLEDQRVENLLIDQMLNKGYQGKDALGPITYGERRQLTKRAKFEDRRGYFKRMHPEGRYIRVDKGNGKFVELYSLVPKGNLYRVDPSISIANPTEGTGGEILKDVADVEGQITTPTTAAAIAASIIFPPSILGSAAVGGVTGAVNILEQWAVNETGKSFDEMAADPDVWKNAALVASLEATVNKVAPFVGARVKNLVTGENSSILAGKVPLSGLKAQAAAERLDLPLITVGQLVKGPIFERIAGQVAALSKLPGRVFNRQMEAVYNKLKEKAATPDGVESFTAAELHMYLDLQGSNLSKELTEMYASRVGPDGGAPIEQTMVNIRAAVKELGTSMNHTVDRAYTAAFELADADGVVFDLSPIQRFAQELRVGTQTRAGDKVIKGETIESSILDPTTGRPITKTTPDKTVNLTERVENRGGRLGELLDKFENVWSNQNVASLSVNDKGRTFTFNALKQIKAMRDEVSELAFAGTDVESRAAKDLLKHIDEVMNNPSGGGTAWKEAWAEAGSLAKQRSQILRSGKMHNFFAESSEVNPQELSKKFWTGEFNGDDWDMMYNWLISASKTPAGRDSATKLMSDVRNGFLQDLARTPSTIGSRLTKLKNEDPKLYMKLVPVDADRKALERIADKSTWLQSDAITANLTRDMSEASRILELTRNMTDNEFSKFISQGGGFNGNRALNMRASIMDSILKKAVKQDPESGAEIVDAKILSDEIKKLVTFDGDYANLSPLFKSAKHPEYLKELQDIRTYVDAARSTEDLGTSLQSAEVVANLQKAVSNPAGAFGALKLIFQSNLVAKALAQPASVSQLKQIHGKRWLTSNKGSVYATILDRIRQGFVENSESAKEEVLRTDEAPNLGDVSSVAPDVTTAPPAPTQVVSAPPIAPTTPAPTQLASAPQIQPPPRASQGAGITNFSSLFPRDELGGAIANRRNQGIMGLA